MNRRKYEIEESEGGRETKEEELRIEFLIPSQHRKVQAIRVNFRLAHQSEVDKN
jgi:hypothetical protein